MRIMLGQIVVIAVGAIAFAATAALLGPRLFAHHLALTGETDQHVQDHAQQAFEDSFAIALVLGVVVSILGAGVLSWFLTRKVSEPVEHLAQAAQAVAAGNYNVTVPHETFGRELAALSDAFDGMAAQLAATEASRQQLLAELAHELRTPAATLEAHIDGMEDGIVVPTAETFEIMRQQVARLRRLTNDIRTLTEVEAHVLDLHLQPAAINAVVEAACGSAQHGFTAKNVTLVNLSAPSSTVVLIDSDRVQQVMANLLENALRHTPEGGTVTVASSSTASTVTITVEDTGDGIAADQLDRIFDPFYRGDVSRHNDGEGAGLGLTIARGIMNDLGGDLTATSEGPGRGSQLHASIPRIPKQEN